MLKLSTPKLMVKRQSDLLQEEEEDFQMPSVYANLDSGVNVSQLHSFGPSQQEVSFIPTWDLQSNYSLKIIQATHVNVTENHKVHTYLSIYEYLRYLFSCLCLNHSPEVLCSIQVYVKCGIYYGAESLCDSQTTRPRGEHQGVCDWNENLEFNLNVCDLPRSAKLCFVLYSSRDALAAPKGKKKKKSQKEVRDYRPHKYHDL